MKRKFFLFLFMIMFIALFVVIVTNYKVANQLLIGVQDIYDGISQVDETVLDAKDIKINDLQPQNCTYYYDKLTDEQQSIYKSIAMSIKDLNKKAKIKEYNYTDEQKLMSDVKISMQYLLLDHPEVFYVKNDYTVSTIELLNSCRVEVELEYTVTDKKELDSKISKLTETINNILASTENMSVFDKELYIHDSICKHATYYKYENINDVPEECHNIYGCLISNMAVCDGLSKTFQILLDKCHIESITVTGFLQEQSHAWNMVKLEDEWYHVDLTSNKSVKNQTDKKEEIIHSYFNITTEQIKNSNKIDMEDVIPVANSIDNNFYIKTGRYINTGDNFTLRLKQILDMNENNNLAEFAVNEKIKSVPEKMVYVFQDKKYNKYVNTNSNKFNYYNILNTYILITK